MPSWGDTAAITDLARRRRPARQSRGEERQLPLHRTPTAPRSSARALETTREIGGRDRGQLRESAAALAQRVDGHHLPARRGPPDDGGDGRARHGLLGRTWPPRGRRAFFERELPAHAAGRAPHGDRARRRQRAASRSSGSPGSGSAAPQLDGRWFATPRAPERRHVPRVPARGGRQKFSWVHIRDVLGAIRVPPRASGDSTASSTCRPRTRPTTARSWRTLRRVLGVPFGFPAYRWMLEARVRRHPHRDRTGPEEPLGRARTAARRRLRVRLSRTWSPRSREIVAGRAGCRTPPIRQLDWTVTFVTSLSACRSRRTTQAPPRDRPELCP